MATKTLSPKILVVDDEPNWLRVVSLYLRSRNYQVATALSGEEAIQKVAEDVPDLVVADITMPGMDGYELCSRLRRDATTRALPFIFLTARDQDTDKSKARRIGSDDYLTKPCPLERLTQSVETAIDRIAQARRIPLDQIGLSGRIEDVDLLDMIQTLELEQKTGALVLSHGERTGTLYFRDGVIVDADIRSPKREEPLFILLGWKTGRFLFIPDAVPERMPITASMANLLLEDLRALEEHEHEDPSRLAFEEPSSPEPPASSLLERVLARLEEVARRSRAAQVPTADPQVARILVVGVTRSGKSELIQSLVRDLSRSRWAAVGVQETQAQRRTDFGRVRISRRTVLHLIAVRAEKRFWPVWEQCLPGAVAAVVLVAPQTEWALGHVRAFLKARETLAPTLPVHALLPDQGAAVDLPDLSPSERSSGSLADQTVRLTLLDRVLQQWLDARTAGTGSG